MFEKISKDKCMLIIYVLLYLYYAFGIFFQLSYSENTANVEDSCRFVGFISILFQIMFKPFLGFLIALILLLLPRKSFYKTKILKNSNKIMLVSFIIDNIIF